MATEILYFRADWCQPCKQIEPLVHSLADTSSINLIKVDVSEQQDLAMRHNVRSVPVLIRIEDGQPVARVDGAFPDLIEKLFQQTYNPYGETQ